MYKNVASQKIAVYATTLSTGAAKTGDASNITAQISLDGGATAATNDANPAELDATDAPGIYVFDMQQAETNADMIVLYSKSSTSGVSIEPVVIYTRPATVSADMVSISGDTTAADNLEKMFDNTGYSASNSTIGTVTTLTNAPTGMALEATLTAMKGATFDTATDSLEAIRNAITALPAAIGVVYSYYPTAATRTTGGDGGGAYTDLAADDETYFVTNEVNTGTYLDVVVTLATGDTTNHPTDLFMPGYYNGTGAHYVQGYRWDYTLSAWESMPAFTMHPRTTEYGYRCGLYPRNVSVTGEVKLRFLHGGGTGNPAHKLYLDMVQANFNSTDAELATAMAQILSLLQDVDNEVDSIESVVTANLDTTVSSRSTFDATTGRVKLDASQPDYAPSKAGDAMTLTSGAYALVADAVWDETISTTIHNNAGSTGEGLYNVSHGVVTTSGGNSSNTDNLLKEIRDKTNIILRRTR